MIYRTLLGRKPAYRYRVVVSTAVAQIETRMAANEAFASFAAILVSLVRGEGLQRRLGGLDVRSLLALGASGDVERYALTFL